MGWVVHTRIERWGLHLKIRARAENTRAGGWFLFFCVLGSSGRVLVRVGFGASTDPM